MLNEIRFSQYVETGNYTDEIDLENFIKLYINHRPVFGLSPNDIKEAFKLIGRRTDRTSSYVINQSQLLDILQKKGEHLTETELIENLMTLLDKCVNPEIDGLYHADPFVAISNDIPSDVNSLQFIEDILCLQTPQ
jgi:Ca2+-binding EF-hand superfamily protein